MIRLITRVATQRSAQLLALLILALPILAIAGAGVGDRLSVGGFLDPAAESSLVADTLEADFGSGAYGFVLLLEPHDKWVYSDENVDDGVRITDALESEAGVGEVVSFYNVPEPAPPSLSPLRDFTGKRALIGVTLIGDEDEQRTTAARLHESYVVPDPVFDIRATGSIEISRVAAEIAESDLQRAELLAAPFVLLGLLWVFRGVRAAVLPLVVAIFAVLGSFVALTITVAFTDVSVFARTLVTALGLGLAIDYSLLLVARFREERAQGRSVELSVSRTMQTAGRTVVFSAATVGSSLLGLLVFPVGYLRSFAFAGVAVVSCAAIASLLVVPPALIRWGSRMGASSTTDATFWGRQADRVMRRPLLWLISVTALLVLLAVPFFGLNAGRVDDRVLPADAGARTAADTIRTNMTWPELNPIHVLAPNVNAENTDAVRSLSDQLLAMDGVVRVDSALGFMRSDFSRPPNWLTGHFRPIADSANGTWFNVVYWWPPEDPRVDDLVADLRSGEAGESLLVGGNNATTSDTVASVRSRLPAALAIIGLVTFVLLFLMTGSVLVPLKAIVLNMLSLSATFGALVWVFQEGHLGSWFGITATGRLDVFTPILMFCVAFGLSMDYEVFLLARIKEEFDLTDDNAHAVQVGLGRTGPIVTAAALLLATVFLAIATSSVAIVRMFGIGLALAVLTDAFLVRGTITPALMKLTGRANWWAPRWARRLHLRWGVWETSSVERTDAPAGLIGETDKNKKKQLLAHELAAMPLFSRCTPRDLRAIARHVETKRYRRDDKVVVEGEFSDGFFLVLDGELEVVQHDSIVAILTTGDHFGELALIDPAPRSATVVAKCDVVLGVLNTRVFRVLLRDMPEITVGVFA